jgi:hypothetical protein
MVSFKLAVSWGAERIFSPNYVRGPLQILFLIQFQILATRFNRTGFASSTGKTP